MYKDIFTYDLHVEKIESFKENEMILLNKNLEKESIASYLNNCDELLKGVKEKLTNIHDNKEDDNRFKNTYATITLLLTIFVENDINDFLQETVVKNADTLKHVVTEYKQSCYKVLYNFIINVIEHLQSLCNGTYDSRAEQMKQFKKDNFPLRVCNIYSLILQYKDRNACSKETDEKIQLIQEFSELFRKYRLENENKTFEVFFKSFIEKYRVDGTLLSTKIDDMYTVFLGIQLITLTKIKQQLNIFIN